MKRPTLRKGPAAHYAAPNEIIYEFSNGKVGGLIAIRTLDDGRLLVNVYNTDAGVIVNTDARAAS